MTDVIPVLLYHSVSDSPSQRDRPYSVSRACFAEHADAVRASGRVPICITDLAAGLRAERRLPERPVALTFDDGFADTYDAVEIALGRGVWSTVYVTTGAVGSRGRLSHEAVAELAQSTGVEIGAHGVRHRYLDELDDRELAHEVRGSKGQLEDLTQATVNSFAYPHGAYNARVRQAVILAEYRSAAAVKNAVSHVADDPFAIARWTVTLGTPAWRIAQVLEGEDLPRAWAHERLRTRVFRTARRQRRRAATRLGRR
jgi:peptidoglycan/xylan/chitin deacetylase (PgdA/CDA1 family)